MATPTKEQCLAAWKQHGSKSKAAKALGIPRSTLQTKVKGCPDPNAKVVKVAETITVQEEHWLKKENRRLRSQVSELIEKQAVSAELNSLFTKIENTPVEPPRWLAPAKSNALEKGIITALLSDTHFDEVVHPEQMNFVNEYNREIATLRLRNFFNNVISTARYNIGVQIDGLVLALLGDIVSGNIHEELKETNDARILETVLYWSEQLIAGIRLLLEIFPKIYVPCVVGNHGRLDKKPRHKFRVNDNFDWLIYKLIEREFKGVEEVTFGISTSADQRYRIYNTRFQLTHGDQFKGGSGISGLLSPLMIGDARKRKREQAISRAYDFLMMGHWHQLGFFKGIITNGSLKGYDEFAMNCNFDFEPPQQALFLTQPKHGITHTSKIFVADETEKYPMLVKEDIII